MSNEKLKPCWSCGSTAHRGKTYNTKDYVFCDSCIAMGSIAIWNTRPAELTENKIKDIVSTGTEHVLNHFQLSAGVEGEEDTNYPLVDALSLNSKTIKSGQKEISYLTDDLTFKITKAILEAQRKKIRSQNAPDGMNDKTFWNMARQNAKEVKKWPKWMREITINARTIATGQFKEEVNGKKRRGRC